MLKRRHAQFALIVEDHPLVSDSLVACIRECEPALQVETVESLRAARAILDQPPAPWLIVTDLTLTDANGMEAVRALRAAAPESPLLVFTALDDPGLRNEAQALGVRDYLIKSAAIQTLRNRIRDALGARQSRTSAAPEDRSETEPLFTPRQIAVLAELTAGRSNPEIAARMRVSEETVRSHMKEIFVRLGVKNRTEAVVRYLRMSRLSDRSG